MKNRNLSRYFFFLSSAILISNLANASVGTRLASHLPPALTKATDTGRLSSSRRLSLTVVLPLRNQAGLAALITRLHDPKDVLYGKFLTPAQFADQFGPSYSDIASVSAYLESNHLNVSGISTNTIQVSGLVRDIEDTFNIEMHSYKTAAGRSVFSPTENPEVDNAVASKISAIVGLNNFSKFVTHHHRRDVTSLASTIGTGPGGGLSPSDISKAYSFSNLGATGANQTLGLMELDGYTASDVSAYAKEFNLGTVPSLQNILVDGATGTPSNTDGPVEVTLDIELMMAVAPGASKIIVYEGPNTDAGLLDTYTKIADDNLAKEISTSWGEPEGQSTSSALNAENAVFMQMAAQGQSNFAAAGDAGAYDAGTTLSVDDPSSQPYVVGTGGTTLSLNSDGSYRSESSWGIPAAGKTTAQGAGGGISAVWPIPSWQAGLGTTANKGSTTMRMVPDVSLNANPNTGYAMYVKGAWGIVGGTSCAAPLWAAFSALVNQELAANGLAPLGFANLSLYKLATSSLYSQIFNDVNDNTTNLYYPAVTGFDLSTGWGSMKALALLTDLTSSTPTTTPLSAPTGLSAVPHNQIALIELDSEHGRRFIHRQSRSRSQRSLYKCGFEIDHNHIYRLWAQKWYGVLLRGPSYQWLFHK